MPSTTPEPQAILAPLTSSAIFLTVTVRPDADLGAVRDAVGGVGDLVKNVGFRDAASWVSCVVGIGAGIWDQLTGAPRPKQLRAFLEIRGEVHTAVATPGDLLFHIRAATPGPCFELGRILADKLRGAADVVDETHGFRYFEQRDLLGFVDGTENPEDEDAADAALVGDEDPGFAGGSYVIVQKYLHDMSAWHALSVGEQERVIGRTKMEDVELDDDVKPANAHVALNDLPDADDGRAREILRSNMPFGELGKGEFGTYFIGYAGHVEDTELMLENMFLGFPPGNYDRILDFSTAVTGTLFYCPTVDFLEDQPASPSLTGDPAAIDPSPATPDGSLGIGDLGRSTS